MQIPPITQPAPSSRFTREPEPQARPRMSHRDTLEGSARPGDILILAGGAMMRDRNENGLVDGYDERVDPGSRGSLVDVRA